MIVSVRGTNGSGKSTLVRKIMGRYPTKILMFVEGRRRPLGQIMTRDPLDLPGGEDSLFVPGHYEIANGGMDTIKDINYAYDLICHHASRRNVLYEGKNMSDGWRRVAKTFTPDEVMIITISHPWRECLESVRQRGHKIRESTIERLHHKCEADHWKLVGMGYQATLASREQALKTCEDVLGW